METWTIFTTVGYALACSQASIQSLYTSTASERSRGRRPTTKQFDNKMKPINMHDKKV